MNQEVTDRYARRRVVFAQNQVAKAMSIAAVTDTTITGSSLWARKYIEKGADTTMRSWPSRKSL